MELVDAFRPQRYRRSFGKRHLSGRQQGDGGASPQQGRRRLAHHGVPVQLTAMRFDGLIFDFDGVLLESEYAGNAQLADWLTQNGHPTSVQQAMDEFMGLSGLDFFGAVERWIGRSLPDDFHEARAAEDRRAIEEGIAAVEGAAAFVRSL